MKPIGLIRFDKTFKHFQAVADALAAFGVAEAAGVIEGSDFLDGRDDVDAVS